ncbi:MAG: tetratricopeptide repeat protein, partial [Coriobacteriales bacterium]|nr:tetratricopeptide repeat protein [Coriobacteriales bacterium]
MNQQTFELGYRAYQSGDWAGAADAFARAKSASEVNGQLEHLLGNCLMKLGRYGEAADAYGRALQDASYGMVGALNTNRGRALLAAGRVSDAIGALNAATQDKSYATPYKAYMALGGACRASGDIRAAGIAYRNAAIDESNPDPSGSLRKLGGCFMDLGRPGDAIESYRTALDFANDRRSQNVVNCDLALAYVATNRMNEAVDAFDRATADRTLVLSPETQASYDAARNAVAARSGERRPSETDDLLAAAGYGGYADPLDPTGQTSDDLMPSPEDTGFFSMNEEELVQDDNRRRRGRGGKILIFLLVLLLILGAAGGFAYYSGFGWPTQESVVQGIFKAKTEHDDANRYIAGSLSEEARQQIVALIPAGAKVNITGVNRSMSNSEVLVTATLADGGEQNYQFKMVRDGLGWKISALEPIFVSLGSNNATQSTSGQAQQQQQQQPQQQQPA